MRLAASVMLLLAGLAQERPVAVVQAPDSPVRLEHSTVVSADDGPPVLIYAATNLTNDPLEQFTVMAFIFKADGTLKARQLAPARRTLSAHETKYLRDGARRLSHRAWRLNRRRGQPGAARRLGSLVACGSSGGRRSQGSSETLIARQRRGIIVMVMRSRFSNRATMVAVVVVFAMAGASVAFATAAVALAQFRLDGFGDAYRPLPNIPYDGRFTFVRVRYRPAPGGFWPGGRPSWIHGYPLAEQNLMKIMNEVSYLGAHDGHQHA